MKELLKDILEELRENNKLLKTIKNNTDYSYYLSSLDTNVEEIRDYVIKNKK